MPDFGIAKDFYQKLGFNVASDDKINNGIGYFLMERKGAILNLYGGSEKVYNQAYFKRYPKDTPRGFEIELTIPIAKDEIDDYFATVKRLIPDSVDQDLMQKTDRALSWRDFRVVDPFGFYLRFVEPINWKICHCKSGKEWKDCCGK